MDCTNCIYYQACNSIFINFCGKVVNRYKDGCQNFKSNNEFFIIQKQQFAYWIGETTTSTNIKTIYDDWYCSACGHYSEIRNQNNLGNYCSYCGAKMKTV